MIFNSLEFAIFLSVVLLAYHASPRVAQKWVLLVAGYVFYGAWDPRFLFLVSLSTVLDYCTGLMIGKGRMSARQRLVATGYLFGFGLVFLLPEWSAVSWPSVTRMSVDWSRFFTAQPVAWRVLPITAIALVIAHALYPVLARLPEAGRRKLFLRCSLVGQLGMLAFFKYYNFFIDSADHVASRFGASASTLHLDILLPIGISFYTFQTLSYVLDVYWRKLEPVEKLSDFALFVSYFPPLVAGPIERASHLMPRIFGERRVTFDHVTRGVFLMTLGLFKKVAIADGLAASVASVYDSTGAVGWADATLGTVAFAFQIYCDFSGYSDIASGVSLLFGIDLLKNFDQPYFSTNPSEFWRRWHISLSSWLRDYLYIPLGGNRGSEARTYLNLMLTMVLGGLWHGAAWNFVMWGFYQGGLLVVHRLLTASNPAPPPRVGLLHRLPRMAVFFAFVCYGWLLFRATSFGQIAQLTGTLFGDFSDMTLHMRRPPLSALLSLPLLLLFELAQFSAGGAVEHLRRTPVLVRSALLASLVALVLLGASNEPQQFIYFQF